MTHQDRLSIIITFVIGIFVGGYLYLTGFLPTYHLPEAMTKDAYEGLVLIADAYGACQIDDTCLSFQLLPDRSFTAVIGAGSTSYTRKSDVSRGAMSSFIKAISPAALNANSQRLAEYSCRYTGPEATNFRFQVTYEGKNYVIDTCQSQVDYQGALWKALVGMYREVAINTQ
jgi:hypothetical protein